MNGRIFIEEVEYGETEGGLACGPVSGPTVVSIRYRKDGKSIWFHNVDVEGIPNMMVTDDDIHEKLLDDKYVDDNIDHLNSIMLDQFEGIELGEYPDIIWGIDKNPDNPAAPFLKYVVCISRDYYKGPDHYIEIGKGRYADEIDLPFFDEMKKDEEDEEDCCM